MGLRVEEFGGLIISSKDFTTDRWSKLVRLYSSAAEATELLPHEALDKLLPFATTRKVTRIVTHGYSHHIQQHPPKEGYDLTIYYGP